MFRTLLLACALCTAGAAGATTITHDFSAGAAGFTVSGGTPSIALGGPAGASDPYLRIRDGRGGNMALTFGTGFSGNLSAFDGGTLSLDFIQTAQRGGRYLAAFGTLTIRGSAGAVSADIIAPNPDSLWRTASVTFSAATFGTSQAKWDAILGDVGSFSMITESWYGVSEVVGFDNVTLAAVPLPAGGLLMLAGLGGLAAVRKRRRAA